MAITTANFIYGFFVFCITSSITFIFVCAILAWILSRVMGASIGFRVGGCNSLRDVMVKFKKGAVESVLVGEIKLSLSHSLVKLVMDFSSLDPKMQLVISNLEIVTRPSTRSTGNKKTKKPRSRKSGKSTNGKWIMISNIARYLSLSVTNLVLKTPKVTIEFKELNVDLSKDEAPESYLFVRVQILPIVVHFVEPKVNCDQASNFSGGGSGASSQTSVTATEKPLAPSICETFSISCEFGHDSDMGIAIKNVDISIGEVNVNLNEGILEKRKSSSESHSTSDRNISSDVDSENTVQPPKKQQTIASYCTKFPDKVSFNLPKLSVNFSNREHGISVENNITGVQLKITKFRSTEDVDGITHLDFHLMFSEIQLLREASSSILELVKLDLACFVYVPIQEFLPVRAEIEINLKGLGCNIIVSRLKSWLLLHSSFRKKKMVLREESSVKVKPKSSNSSKIAIIWKCNVSLPEITIALSDMAGSPLYHGCLQSSHLFANNNTGITVHFELGELNLQLAEEFRKCLKEISFGVESNSGSILHITKVNLDWGKMDMKSSEEDAPMIMLGLSLAINSIGICLSFKRLEPLISTTLSLKALLKSPTKKSAQNRRHASSNSTKPNSRKGFQMLKFNLEQCSVCVFGETGLENTVIADPKRVNYGSQGGRVLITDSADGTPRTAKIMSTASNELQNVNFSISLEILHFKLCMNKEKQSVQMEIEKTKSIYEEYIEKENNKPVTKVSLFDMQNAKFLQRNVKENVARSLFSATDITIRWEPDLMLSVIELVLRIKLVVQNSKVQDHGNEQSKEDLPPKRDTSIESGNLEKKKKKELIFAIDVEMLNISAEMGDGVEIMAQVQSIFSENARIGVLLEGLILGFNGARLFKTSRIQISRIPSKSVSSSSSSDAKKISPVSTTWDWVIQGLDVYVCLPFRLQLRAIDDALEDMLRALKLIIAAKTSLIFPAKKDNSSSKPKNPSSVKFGCVKFFIRKLTIEIEEEPIQGWLDEHYQLLKKEAGELAVRFSFLDEFISKAKQDPKPSDDTKVEFNGIEVDVNSPTSIESLREEIYKRSFRRYYQACQNLVKSEGSGACSEGFQSGFKPSTSRSSLFMISASDLNVSLKMIDGGDDGMIEVLKKLDPIVKEYHIPFARLYGGNIVLNTASLAIEIRDFPYPLFSGSSAKCEGSIVLAQQATFFQPQMTQDVYVGRWRKVTLLRSLSGTTPPMKTYLDLPLHFQKGVVSFGVSYEPVFADISYAFTVALRRANLSVRNPGPLIVPPKKEKSLPWWDDMRNYIHGKTSLLFSETCFHILATTDPYEKLDKLQIVTNSMEIHQSDGRILISAQDFKILLSSLESLANKQGIKIPSGISSAFLDAPTFIFEVAMDWDCDSCTPMNHFLFALPIEGKTRDKVFDPFRSTALSLQFNISFRSIFPSSEKQPTSSNASTVVKLGAHDLEWIKRFWNLNYLPPHKLRMFSRWPRFGVPRIVRSGNLSMDKVMTEFMIRLDSTSTCIKNIPLHDDDPSKGLTFMMNKLKFELCFGRGSKQKYTFESKRDLLVIVYEGLDFYMPKVFLNREDSTSIAKLANMTTKSSQSEDKNPSEKRDMMQKNHDDGFLLSGDYFTIRRQSPKADSSSLVAWQDAGRKNAEMNNVHVHVHDESEIGNRNDTGETLRSDDDDDDEDGYNVVVADNCRRVFVYGLKFLWNIENRDAVVSFADGLSKAFEPSKPSPSRQNAQRKLLEEKKKQDEAETNQDDGAENKQVGNGEDVETKQDVGAYTNQDVVVETHQDVGSEPQREDGAETHQDEVSKCVPSSNLLDPPTSQTVGTSGSVSSQQDLAKEENLSTGKLENENDIEEGTRHLMVNVIEPQFNLHSQDAKGRFLLAAASGRVLAQSFHSVLQVGHDMIQQALGNNKDVSTSEVQPEIAWKRMEMSVMLEHVQAHVAPTDVDLGAGVQWLPKILRGSPKVKRTGALLEKVFMPCDMYFQYTRHKGGTPELKVKPLKELKFNSHNITATMTSRHFQVMLDVLSNLLFARLPKARKNVLSLSVDDDDIVDEEVDAVVPDGIEEVELEKINFEVKDRAHKLILNDIRNLSLWCDITSDQHLEKEGDLWMMAGGIPVLVQGLKRDLVSAQKYRKEAYASMSVALQKAAQVQLMEKEKNKSPSYAMRISLQIKKIVWSMLLDGKSFAEVEINDMIFDFDRDFKDVGLSQFTTKYLVFRNCLPNAKSDMLLSAWNPPPEWGKKVMLRVDARQGAPKDGRSAFEHLEVEIYPLKIHLTEAMYRMMWGYFFPVEEEHDPQHRKEVWKVSTTAGARRAKKGEASASTGQPSVQADSAQASKGQNAKTNPATGSNPELRRTASFDKTWEETVAESVADELVLEGLSASKTSPFATIEDEASKNKSKDSKGSKAGHSSQEDKKGTKLADEKRPHKMIDFHNIKISQVELLITYEGTRFSVYDKKLLMDQFHRVQFTGSWQRLFSRVKKHVIWGILKSVTGMQGKKFKDKGQIQPSGVAIPETDLTISDKELAGKSDQYPSSWPRPIEGAGDGFVTSIKGLFSNQRKKAKAFVLKTMKGEEGENDIKGGEWSENDVEISPFARQLTIVKAKKLIKRHTKKLNSKGHKGSPSQLPLPISSQLPLPISLEIHVPSDSDSSSGTPPYDDIKE